jgi:hypothetical protein
MLRYTRVLLVFLAAYCGACSKHPALPNTTLPSGRQIMVSGIIPMHFPNGQDALILNCESDIPISDHPALRKEADEIWAAFFQKRVESANMKSGVIRISHSEGGGLITHAQGYGFVFEKRADGQWHCLEDDKKQ